MRNDLIRVTLQGDDAHLRDLLEQSGVVEIVDTGAEVLVWHLPQDADGLPAELRGVLGDPNGPAVLGLADTHPSRWFDEALDFGIDGVVCLPRSPSSSAWRWPRPALSGIAAAPATCTPPGRCDLPATHTCSRSSRPRADRARP